MDTNTMYDHETLGYDPDFFKILDKGAFKNAIKNYFTFAFDLKVDEVFLMTENSEVVYASSAAHINLGYDAGELIGLTVANLDFQIVVETWPPLWEELKKQNHLRFETLQVMKSGKLRSVVIDTFFYVEEDKEFMLCFVKDAETAENSQDSQEPTA